MWRKGIYKSMNQTNFADLLHPKFVYETNRAGTMGLYVEQRHQKAVAKLVCAHSCTLDDATSISFGSSPNKKYIIIDKPDKSTATMCCC